MLPPLKYVIGRKKPLNFLVRNKWRNFEAMATRFVHDTPILLLSSLLVSRLTGKRTPPPPPGAFSSFPLSIWCEEWWGSSAKMYFRLRRARRCLVSRTGSIGHDVPPPPFSRILPC